MSFIFKDAFPSLQLKGRAEVLLEDTIVTRVTTPRTHDFLNIYLESDHVITKDIIREVEREIKKQVINNQTTIVRIFETFKLPKAPELNKLYEEYSDSALLEIEGLNIMFFNMMRTATVSFDSPDVMKVSLADIPVYHVKEKEFADLLDDIYIKRFGCAGRIEFEYHEINIEQKEDEEYRALIRSVSENERKSAEKFIGAKESDITKEPAEKEKPKDDPKPSPKPQGGFSNGGGRSWDKNRTGFRNGNAQRKNPMADDPNHIFGFVYPDEKTIPLSELNEGMTNVSVKGMVFSYKAVPIKDERTVVSFNIADFTDAISCKMYIDTAEAPAIQEKLEPGTFVRVTGFLEISSGKFDHGDLYMKNVKGIVRIDDFRTPRADKAERKRVELHCHTKMSDMDGVSECKDIVKRAFKWGHKAVAITDNGVVQGFTDAGHVWDDLWGGKKGEKNKRIEAGDPDPDRQDFFKILYGVEAYLVDDLHRIVTGDANLPLLETDYVVYDIETTGLSPVKNKIIEFGAVKVSGGKIVDRFSTFVNPEEPIPYEITKLTSITDDDVSDADNISLVMPRFLSFCEGCVWVAHNAEFDVNFVKEKCRELGTPADPVYIDTLPLSRVQLPGHSKFTLDAVAKALGVDLGHHHRAVDDAECTANIFVKMLEQLRDEGMKTLDDVNKKGASSTSAISKLRPSRCTILAKNELGRIHLYTLVSESHLTYFNRFPKIPKSLVEKYREGLIVGSGNQNGELMDALIEGHTSEQISNVVSFYDFLEVQPPSAYEYMVENEHFPNITSIDDIRDIVREVTELGKQFKKPVVATGDVYFLDPDDAIYRDVIYDSKSENRDRILPPTAPLYFRTTEEMLEEFSFLGSQKADEIVIKNSNMIADMCECISPVRPDKCPPVIPDSDKMLEQICYNKAHEIYGPELPPIVTERLERELKSIITNGFAVMYIIAQKLVWKSVEDGYLVGSRGSVGSSFVATMAGITEVNPLVPHYYCSECHFYDFDSEEVLKFRGKAGVDMPDRNCPNCGKPLCKEGFDIPFETFLGFKGNKEPDIDLNFSGEYQAKAHKYTEVIFGTGQTFRAGTVGTVADKTAFGFIKKYFEKRGIHKRNAEVEFLQNGCMGVKRSTGQHPGGIVVLPNGEDINTFTPVQHPANDMTTDTITTHFDYHSIDHNLLKLDILGHDDPTMIRMLQDLIGFDPIRDIPLDDKKVMTLFQNTEALGITPDDIGGCKLGCLGIPEFGTDFAINLVLQAKPKMFSDLVRISGLSHGTNVWQNNAEVLINNGTADISTAICTRDDIMTYLIGKGVDSAEAFNIMEAVRKGKVAGSRNAQGEITFKDWPEWKEDMIKCNIPDWYIWSCERIEYMFPRAHAAAYVMMAWRIAYCKINYPLEYYAAYYSIRAKAFSYEVMCLGKAHVEAKLDELKKIKETSDKDKNAPKLSNTQVDQMSDLRIVQEMHARGYEFMPIDLSLVKAKQFQVINGKIMPALTSIDGLGASVADAIAFEGKKGKFMSCEDFRIRTKASGTVTDKLKSLGILGDIPESNQMSIFDMFGE